MKLKHAAILATLLVIAAGAALISPLFLRQNNAETTRPKPRVMLSFSVLPQADVITWCQDLSSFLNAQHIGASVFFVGQVAEKDPECVSVFGDRVDIGSQTYSNANLNAIDDYSVKLEEIQEGKMAVDIAGNLSTGIFRAPFGATDSDIYSLLDRSNIQADFSYRQQYNVYLQGHFIKFAVDGYTGQDNPSDVYSKISVSANPSIIFFDNTRPVTEIEHFLSGLKMTDINFVNASELIGSSLTVREIEYGDSRTTPN